ncbi:OmpA family protein [Devosia sp. 2618]|uniref:OmpA family protein n=1 Tax=Devosia sp. 2618 TaxID=3156454 RepID=UPI0033975F61
MIRDLIKWVAPGLATVLGGTTLCLAMTSTEIASDLSTKTAAAIASSGYDWVELSFDGRDLRVSGTTTDQGIRDAAVAKLASLDGIRAVSSDITLAPLATPYVLQASIDGSAIDLSGGVPDETTRQRFMSQANIENSNLQLRSGMPDRRTWVAGAEFAIDQLKYLDQGRATVSDLSVSVSGRAKSERDYRDLMIVLRAGAPSGLTLGNVSITPAVVSPYQWTAHFDGKVMDVSGFVPNAELAERYRTADLSGIPVATGLALGSGEPQGFSALSERLLQQLSRLEYGEATITDGQSTLTGAPATVEIAQAVVNNLQPSGSIVVLEPPRIADYWMSASRQPSGAIVFDGYAPDAATKDAFSNIAGADTSYLQLGRGAPERYRSGVDFGLAALALMGEGRISLHGNILTIAGTARTGADYDALLKIVAAEAPQGVTLAPSEIAGPRVESYQWSASKAATGAIALAGFVPDAASEATLLAAAGASATKNLVFASGAPNNFVASAALGLDLLQRLHDGRVVFDSSGWTITGTPNSAIDKAALEADFATRHLAAAGWSMAVAQPMATAVVAATPGPEVPATPVIEPEAAAPVPEVAEAPVAPSTEPPTIQPVVIDPDYAFSASRSVDGSTIMSGQVPSDAALSTLGAIGNGDTAAVSIAEGAPDSFVSSAETGLRALLKLETGQLNFSQGNWSLSGTTPNEATKTEITVALEANAGAVKWSTDISLPVATLAAVAPPTAETSLASPVDIAACSEPLAEFSARNAILFQSGAAIIAAGSQAALDELATDLSACPDAVVHIEGHTDSDGDETLNLALSVARAEAVVDALVERGVTPARLYAVGYGESTPIADNGTAQGKQLNRRIVVTVQPEHY